MLWCGVWGHWPLSSRDLFKPLSEPLDPLLNASQQLPSAPTSSRPTSSPWPLVLSW